MNSLRERRYFDQMAAGVGRVVRLGDADIADRARVEAAGVAGGRSGFGVVASVGDHVPGFAVERSFDRETVVTHVAVVANDDHAADGRRLLQIDLPPGGAGMFADVRGPIAIGIEWRSRRWPSGPGSAAANWNR